MQRPVRSLTGPARQQHNHADTSDSEVEYAAGVRPGNMPSAHHCGIRSMGSGAEPCCTLCAALRAGTPIISAMYSSMIKPAVENRLQISGWKIIHEHVQDDREHGVSAVHDH